jgi:hypothetical protein
MGRFLRAGTAVVPSNDAGGQRDRGCCPSESRTDGSNGRRGALSAGLGMWSRELSRERVDGDVDAESENEGELCEKDTRLTDREEGDRRFLRSG